MGGLLDYFNQKPTVTFCEQPLDGLIARPWYLVSNLPFIGLGLYFFVQNRPYSRVFGVLSLFIGIASSVYDATFTLWSQHFDLLMMFVFVTFIMSLHLKQLPFLQLLSVRVVVPLSFLMAIMWLGNSSGQILFFLFSLITVITIFRTSNLQSPNFRWMYAAVISIAVGVLALIPDRLQLICFDFGLLNGRSIFHYAGTITIYCLWRYYSELSSNIPIKL